MKKEDINCPPYAPVLMESTRAIGYSIESAVADIVDNSIAAKAKNVSIWYNFFPKPYIAIRDDGKGANEATLKGTVDVSEMMGSEVHLHVNAQGKDVVMIVPTTELDAAHRSGIPYGTEVNFTFRPELIHLFDAETELNLI